MAERQKKRGRPGPKPRGPFVGKRTTFTTRITDNTRLLLNASAEEADRSLSQEVEFRLVQSFLEEKADNAVRNTTLQGVYDSFGGYETFTLMQFAAVAIKAVEQITGKSWRSDPETYNHVADAITRTVAALMPLMPVLPKGGLVHPGLGRSVGETAGRVARDVLADYRTALVNALKGGTDERDSSAARATKK